MTAPWHTLLKPLALGMGWVMLALLALVWNGAPPAARADGPATCTVCLDSTCDYTTIQAAVDDDTCHEIKVAQGLYTGVQGRPVPAGYDNPPASGLITQVVYISRTVMVRGGYTTTDWTTPDSVAQPTTLDAGGLGRALVVAGDISPTIEGLGLTGGDAAGLGGSPWGGGNCGGGAYIISATATLSACRVFSNTAREGGGGLLLNHSPTALSASSVTSNSTMFEGGGLFLYYSPATLNANNIATNTAGTGGGLYLYYSPATLNANSIAANTAPTNHGGGLFLESSDATLNGNSITANIADYGGGLFLDYGSATLSADNVTSNSARYGGGLVVASSNATLTNTVIAGNHADAQGSGLFIASGTGKPPSAPRLLHTTIARNGGGDGSGLYLGNPFGGTAIAWLTNTILVSQTVGITVSPGCTATMRGTLWYDNGANWGGAGTLTHTGDYTGNPVFVDPGGGDYHIGPASAAIDRGVDAGVTADKDGRPRDAFPDLGAYELAGQVTDTYLPVILKGAR